MFLPEWFGYLGVTDISSTNAVCNTPLVTVFPKTQEIPSLITSATRYGLNIACCDQFVIIAGPSLVDIFALSGFNWAKLQRITSADAGFGSAVAITSNANGTAWTAVAGTTTEIVLLYSYSSTATPSSSWIPIQTITVATGQITGISMQGVVLAIALNTRQVLVYNNCGNSLASPWQTIVPIYYGHRF